MTLYLRSRVYLQHEEANDYSIRRDNGLLILGLAFVAGEIYRGDSHDASHPV